MDQIKLVGHRAIKWIVVLQIFYSSTICGAQQKDKLTKEQYKVIEESFKNSGKDETRLFFQTIDYKSWVHLLYGTYYRDENGIGTCTFDDPQLKSAVDQMINHVMNIEVNEFNPKKLGKRFVLIKDLKDQPYLSLTEPIIIENYAFLLFKYTDSESLEIQKRNDKGGWDYECSIPLYVVFVD
ncbi:hypothetical protein [Algoriphagus namhaensis]